MLMRKMIFNNLFVILLSNAIKFTPKSGEVSVQSVLNKNTITVEIKDNGIGMDKN